MKTMSKLGKKFMAGILFILLISLALSILINTKVVEKYYLYQQRNYVDKIGVRLKQELESGSSPDMVIAGIEETESVLITYSSHTKDNETLSNELREKFRQKGLGFQKFWLWDQDYQSAVENGKKRRIYNQDKLNYGILVEYISVKDYLFAIAAIVPNTEAVVSVINQFLTVLHVFSLVIAAILISVLVRHIINPLKKMEEFSEKISRREYDSLEITTGDELELVALSMNQMSQSIQEYQKLLLDKNRQMELLLDNVAHDLKTPISLIKMYAAGIKDGLDDSTFLETILKQAGRMEKLTERLLLLSRISQKEHPSEPVRLDELLLRQMEEYKIIADKRQLTFDASLISNALVMGNPDLISTLFSNLLSNSLKYSSGPVITVVLEKSGPSYVFTISNEAENNVLDLERIWEPFYVGEASRDKALSGTGLGLAIVKKIADQEGYSIHCEKAGKGLQFKISGFMQVLS